MAFKWACQYGHLEVVSYLLASPDLKEHADIHADNDCGLIWACENSHTHVIDFLINETTAYHIDDIESLSLDEESKIKKEEVAEMIKARDLRNQLSNEVLLKKSGSEKTKLLI